jgi:hypothetical protein
MGVKTPTRIVEKVLKLWLSGLTRDEISQKVGTSVGNILHIIKEVKANIPDIVLLREAAVWIRKNGWKQDHFSTAIRHRNFLYGRGLTDEQIDDVIELLDEHCFKRGIKMDSFIGMLENVSLISKRYGCSIEELDDVIEEKESLAKEWEAKVTSLEKGYYEALKRYGLSESELIQYRQDLPLRETINNLKKKIDQEQLSRAEVQLRWAFDMKELTAVNAPEGMEPHEVNKAVQLLVDSPEHFEKEIKSILNMVLPI